jgi:hypothetical protein
MKTNATLSLLAFTFSALSFASVIPGYERPLYSGQAKILKAQGTLASTQNVNFVVTRQDGAKQFTGVELTLDNEVAVFLSVKSVRKIGCGSEEVIAESGQYRISFVDHSNRICKDLVDFAIQGKLERLTRNRKLSGIVSFGVAQIEPVYTIQGEPSINW